MSCWIFSLLSLLRRTSSLQAILADLSESDIRRFQQRLETLENQTIKELCSLAQSRQPLPRFSRTAKAETLAGAVFVEPLASCESAVFSGRVTLAELSGPSTLFLIFFVRFFQTGLLNFSKAAEAFEACASRLPGPSGPPLSGRLVLAFATSAFAAGRDTYRSAFSGQHFLALFSENLVLTLLDWRFPARLPFVNRSALANPQRKVLGRRANGGRS